MDLEKNKQRLEILAAEVEELKNNGGGGATNSYTKAEADDKFAEKTNVYTKTEADNKFVEQGTPIEMDLTPITITLDGGLFPEDKLSVLQKRLPIKIDNIDLIFLGSTRDEYVYGNFHGRTMADCLLIEKIYVIRSSDRHVWSWGKKGGGLIEIVSGQNFSSFLLDPSRWQRSTNTNGEPDNLWNSANLDQVYTNGLYYCKAAVAATLTNCPTTKDFTLIIENWRDGWAVSQTIIEQDGSAIYMRKGVHGSWNEFRANYFNPTDETLTNGGTISATALANALKHVPLSFNAHVCYYSYEDNDNVYYTSTRLNGTSLHTNVVAINKTTGVATFNEFDQS